MSFPRTKYMGSKQAILPFIMSHISRLRFSSALDAFSGSGCVSHALKKVGKRVVANDFHRFAYTIAKATIQNNSLRVSEVELGQLLQKNRRARYFVRRTFTGLYYDEKDCHFIDNTYANIVELRSDLKRSLALAALCRACMKKRPRGIFTFVGKKGWDGRRDLKMSMRDQFVKAVSEYNRAVFSNGQNNKATCLDVFETPTNGVDLVYIDTPYVSHHSDCDYTRRYHFIEGLSTYWQNADIQEETKTKKIQSYRTAFKSVNSVTDAFLKLFDHFKACKLVVSYGSNGVPDRNQMILMLKNFKRKVRVAEISHKYSHGNHGHKVGDNNNDVTEYLFIAT